MRKRWNRLLSLLVCGSLCLGSGTLNVKAAEQAMAPDEFLLQTGMPKEDVQQLDDDVKQFMVDDLKKADVGNFEYVETETEKMIMPRVGDTLNGITFRASAFKSGSVIYIYPEYEFTDDKRPRGMDSFSYTMGDELRPYEFGGQLWYKDYTMSNWAIGGNMIANSLQLTGAEYSGSQLGSPDYAMKIKGCAYCHAHVGTGTDRRIVLGYLYNPNKASYSVSFSYGGVGISYSHNGKAYSAAGMFTLSY